MPKPCNFVDMATKRRPENSQNNSKIVSPNGTRNVPNFEAKEPIVFERTGELAGGWLGWLGPLLATLIAAILRFPRLGIPHALVFDETYYAKDSLSLLYYGYERATIPSPETALLAHTGRSHVDIFTSDPAFIVHPPVGKWIISFGEYLFGPNPFGWRIMVAVLGILTVLITARVTRRLLNSNVAGTLAGLFLALDGLHIAMSRTALLDTILTFFVVSSFGLLIIDRDLRDAENLDNRKATLVRISFTLSLGLACATKWSGIYFTAAFLLLMIGWDFARRTEDDFQARFTGWLKEGPLQLALISFGVVAVYITSWFGWFKSTNAWDRNWATPESSFNFIPASLRSLWHYHAEMLNFHTNLRDAHNYRANPWGWPLMIRPTSFFYEGKPTCGAPACSQEVIPLGNPFIWWGGAFALIALIAILILRKHQAALPVFAGFAAGWIPWLPFAYRTTFQFYSVVYVPFTIMALVLCIQIFDRRYGFVRLTKEKKITTFQDATQDGWGFFSIGSLLIVGALTYYFWPLLVANSIPYQDWINHMWLQSWI
jgi:dolichyl-phosphate-mannose--protein O-mannosyl transferase